MINCQLKPKATAQRYGGRTIARASNDISPTVMIQTIPPKINFDYSLPRNKRDFGINGKLLTDISNIYSQYNLIIPISSWTAVIYKFNRGHLSLEISCKYLKIKGWKYL